MLTAQRPAERPRQSGPAVDPGLGRLLRALALSALPGMLPALPSFHSLVIGLMMPKSSSQVTALGSRSTATGFLCRF